MSESEMILLSTLSSIAAAASPDVPQRPCVGCQQTDPGECQECYSKLYPRQGGGYSMKRRTKNAEIDQERLTVLENFIKRWYEETGCGVSIDWVHLNTKLEPAINKDRVRLFINHLVKTGRVKTTKDKHSSLLYYWPSSVDTDV